VLLTDDGHDDHKRDKKLALQSQIFGGFQLIIGHYAKSLVTSWNVKCSGVMRWLCQKGLKVYVRITHSTALVVKVVTIDEIKKLGQLSAKEHIEEEQRNYPYVGYVLRRISPYFTRFFIDHNVTANQVSALSIITGIVANATFIFGNYYLMLIGCFLYQLWNIFDLVDGEIARVTDVKTAGGKYLETINEPITECGLILSLGIGLSKILNDKTFVFWGLLFALCYALLSAFARTRDMMIGRFQTKERKSLEFQRMPFVKRLYKKARLLFVTVNAYIILTVIVILQLLLVKEAYITFLGLKLNSLSVYFFLYGLLWVVRMAVSAVTNYKYLIKHETVKLAK